MTGVVMAAVGAAGGPQVSINNLSVSTIRFGASTTAAYSLENDGDIMGSNSTGTGITVDLGDWITPKTAAGAAYEARVTVTSGSLDSGTTGSWLALSTTRTWSITQGSIGIKNCVFTVEIRRALDGVVLDSAEITLNAEFSS